MAFVLDARTSLQAYRYLGKTGRLPILLIYFTLANPDDGVAWPTLEYLAETTNLVKSTCGTGRKDLVDLNALTRMPDDYVPPLRLRKTDGVRWIDMNQKELARAIALDNAHYYKPTGYIDVPGEHKDELKRIQIRYGGVGGSENLADAAVGLMVSRTTKNQRELEQIFRYPIFSSNEQSVQNLSSIDSDSSLSLKDKESKDKEKKESIESAYKGTWVLQSVKFAEAVIAFETDVRHFKNGDEVELKSLHAHPHGDVMEAIALVGRTTNKTWAHIRQTLEILAQDKQKKKVPQPPTPSAELRALLEDK